MAELYGGLREYGVVMRWVMYGLIVVGVGMIFGLWADSPLPPLEHGSQAEDIMQGILGASAAIILLLTSRVLWVKRQLLAELGSIRQSRRDRSAPRSERA